MEKFGHFFARRDVAIGSDLRSAAAEGFGPWRGLARSSGRQSGRAQCCLFGLCYSTEFWIAVEVADAACNFQISRGHVSRGL